jgi:hypothetical protein
MRRVRTGRVSPIPPPPCFPTHEKTTSLSQGQHVEVWPARNLFPRHLFLRQQHSRAVAVKRNDAVHASKSKAPQLSALSILADEAVPPAPTAPSTPIALAAPSTTTTRSHIKLYSGPLSGTAVPPAPSMAASGWAHSISFSRHMLVHAERFPQQCSRP